MSKWILIAGYGSIGRRHFRNLQALGYEDVRLYRSGRPPAEGFETPDETIAYTDLDAALAKGPHVVVVSNPSALHAEVARAAVGAGAAVLMEKPVCATLEDARLLESAILDQAGVCSMAYVFRYHPLYRTLAEWVAEDRLGRVFHAHSWQASYLPDWHPWEDYRSGYAAREDLGGGVVRTLDHDLDMLRWMFGSPTEVLASIGSLSGIDVEVEDTADLIFRFSGRKQANVHLCFGRRDYARGMWVVGEDGTASLDWRSGSLIHKRGADVIDEVQLPEGYDLNEAYTAMLSDAMEQFAREPKRPAIPLSAGIGSLEMAVAALESGRTSRVVPVPGHAIEAEYSQ